MNEFEQHDTSWDDRLQDLLDGDLDLSERAGVESHINTCPRCRRRHTQLKRLDVQLTSKLPSLHLDAAFDRQIFARIDALEGLGRDRARRRVELELQQNLAALSRDWRRRVSLLIGGAIGGIGIALALMGWAEMSGITERLLTTLNGLAVEPASLRTGMAVFTGALAGAGISGWLARSLH